MSVILKIVKSTYKSALRRYPIATQAVQASLLMGAGDVIAQHAVEKVPMKELNLRRTAEFSALGLFLVGPTLRFWYGRLDRLISPKQVAWKVAVKKASLDQFVFAPAFIVLFTGSISYMQGMNTESVVQRLKSEYATILKANYMIWPTAQLINFALIPLSYQVLFVQIVAIIWNTYLSLKLGNVEE